MRDELFLAHATLLANQSEPLHSAFKLTADSIQSKKRQPAAFCIVLDRSGSLKGEPLMHAPRASRTTILDAHSHRLQRRDLVKRKRRETTRWTSGNSLVEMIPSVPQNSDKGERSLAREAKALNLYEC